MIFANVDDCKHKLPFVYPVWSTRDSNIGMTENKKCRLHSCFHSSEVPDQMFVTVVIHLIKTALINKERLCTEDKLYTWCQLLGELRNIKSVMTPLIRNIRDRERTSDPSKPMTILQGGSLNRTQATRNDSQFEFSTHDIAPRQPPAGVQNRQPLICGRQFALAWCWHYRTALYVDLAVVVSQTDVVRWWPTSGFRRLRRRPFFSQGNLASQKSTKHPVLELVLCNLAPPGQVNTSVVTV